MNYIDIEKYKIFFCFVLCFVEVYIEIFFGVKGVVFFLKLLRVSRLY